MSIPVIKSTTMFLETICRQATTKTIQAPELKIVSICSNKTSSRRLMSSHRTKCRVYRQRGNLATLKTIIKFFNLRTLATRTQEQGSKWDTTTTKVTQTNPISKDIKCKGSQEAAYSQPVMITSHPCNPGKQKCI